MADPDITRRLSVTGRLLVRSGAEIGRTLEGLRAASAPLTAHLDSGELLFLSRLLHVDEEAQALFVAWSESKAANTVLLAARNVSFTCNHEGLHCEFVCANPTAAEWAKQAAIRLSFPSGLVILQRRAERRYAVPPSVPLRCEVDCGPVSFFAQVVDISLNGLGALVYDPDIQLAPGTRLSKVRVLLPGRISVEVGLEVCYVRRMQDERGEPVNRAGCRLIGDPAAIESLVRLFVAELGADGLAAKPAE